MTNTSLSFAFGLGIMSSFPLMAGPLQINSSEVSFVAIGKPGFLKINGKGATLSGNLTRNAQNLNGELHVPMEKFVTGIDLRDDHMRKKYFEVTKYPEATLKITRLILKEGDKNQDTPFQGLLNFHGEEHPVEGTADITISKTRYEMEARFNIQLSTYKIDIPSYAGVKVADKVDITAKLNAEEKP